MGHVEDRARERTKITDREIASARSYVKNHRKSFRKGQTYSIVAPGRKGYYIVGDVGDKRKKHVIKTVYGVNMRPPGNLIQNAKLEHDFIKAAEALFTLEKTASSVSYSIALMECDKLASVYFGYELDEWLEYPEEMRKEAMVNWARSINAGGNRFLSKLYNKMGWQGGAQRAAAESSRSFSNLAKSRQAQAMQTTNVDKATRLQTQAADNSIDASRQATFAGNAERATQQAEHANRQLGVAEKNLAKDTNLDISGTTVGNIERAGLNFERKITRPAAMNQTAAPVKPTVVGQQQTVAPTVTPPKQTKVKGGTNPTTDAANPINWKQVGVGAGLATAGLGAGYGGMKYVQHRNNQRQQMMGGMPKMASWFSFTEKTASYTEALGMYKEALSRADKNLINAYQQAVSDHRAAVKAEGQVMVEKQNAWKKMPKGPEKTKARNAFFKEYNGYVSRLNNPPTVDSFLRSQGYSGEQLTATKNKLENKMTGARKGKMMRPAPVPQPVQPTPTPTPPAPQPTLPAPAAPAAPTPPASTPTPPPAAPTAPAPTGQAPLPNAADVNPRHAANVTSTVDAPKTIPNQAVTETAEAAAKPTTAAPTKSVAPSTPKPAAPKVTVPKAAPTGRLGMILGGTALAGAGLYGLNKMNNQMNKMMQPSQEKAASVEYRGRTFPGYNKPMKSDRPNKKKMVLAKKGDQVKLIHYGHSGYKHNYSKSAKKNYLTRSAGIRNKSGGLTKDDKFSANYWARRDLWPSNQKADGSDKKR